MLCICISSYRKGEKSVVIFESECDLKVLNFNVFCNYHDHQDHDGMLHKASRKVNFVQPNIGLNYSKIILIPMVIFKLLVTFDFKSSKLGCTLITCEQ